MRINAQQRQLTTNRSPTSQPFSYYECAYAQTTRQGRHCQLWGVNQDHFHSKLLLIQPFESHQGPFRSLTFPPVLRDWVIKGRGMSSLVYATGHIKDPVPLIEKRRGLSPGGRFPPSFIHQIIIITGLNKLQLYVLALKMALDADRA